jgi:hypothetical protein
LYIAAVLDCPPRDDIGPPAVCPSLCRRKFAVSVEPFHLFRYLDEQSFRYNNRATPEQKMTDADRFQTVMGNVFGHRLTWKQLTGKLPSTTQLN